MGIVPTDIVYKNREHNTTHSMWGSINMSASNRTDYQLSTIQIRVMKEIWIIYIYNQLGKKNEL